MNKILIPTWMIHRTCDGKKVVFHTEGLDKYDSLELELNLTMSDKQGMISLNIIGLEIANGRKFEDREIDDTLFTCKIAFKKIKGIYLKKDVLRVIVVDKNSKFPWEEGCEEPFKSQMQEQFSYNKNSLLMLTKLFSK